MKSMKPRKRFLVWMVLPYKGRERAPKWWPRVPGSRRIARVGVLKDGIGWCLEAGDLLTKQQVEDAATEMSRQFKGATFEIEEVEQCVRA